MIMYRRMKKGLPSIKAFECKFHEEIPSVVKIDEVWVSANTDLFQFHKTFEEAKEAAISQTESRWLAARSELDRAFVECETARALQKPEIKTPLDIAE